MFKHTCLLIALGIGAAPIQPAFAERFAEVPRPIDYFVNGEEILAVNTLRDDIRAQGNLETSVFEHEDPRDGYVFII